MNATDNITFFHAIEKSIWKENVNANKYLATLSILFVALTAACYTAGSSAVPLLQWNLDLIIPNAVMLAAFLWVLNTAESVFACKDILTACLRSLLLLAAMALAFGAGILLGIIAIAIVSTILFFFAFYGLTNLFDDLISRPSGGTGQPAAGTGGQYNLLQP